jgi:hypothetical protein
MTLHRGVEEMPQRGGTPGSCRENGRQPQFIVHNQVIPTPALVRAGLDALPAAIAAQGERAGLRFIEFFTAAIRNRNTRMAYARAVKRVFDWCDKHHLGLEDIEPIAISAYLIRSTSSSKISSVFHHPVWWYAK